MPVQAAPAVSGIKQAKLDFESSDHQLNTRYTFDSFVVGKSNEFAHAASHAVAEQPSKAYNPLFLYGGVGMGKTHLMHAIGHTIKKRNPTMRLSYVSAEKFTNEVINSLRFERMISFRDRFRTVDVLLVDDIQFIAGKERTQEEFFHTFNALYEQQKQIVISSDCLPKDINSIEGHQVQRARAGRRVDEADGICLADGGDDFAGDRAASAAEHHCFPGKARHYRPDPEARERGLQFA